MKLNHLSLSVPDVATTAAFFKTYFQFEALESKGNNIIVSLKGAGDFILVLTTSKVTDSYPVDFHVGFFLDNKEMVADTFEKLKSGGFIDSEGPAKIRDRYGFYFYVPGNVLMEVSCVF